MWKFIRSRTFQGNKFRRQLPIGDYIVDFCCLEKKLIVELDGGQHLLSNREDEIRSNFLQQEGFRVIRFWDNEVLKNIEGVLETIRLCIEDYPHLTPLPSRERRQSPRCSASRDSNKGIVLIVAILALLVMAIFLPALLFVVSNETKWSVKQKKSTTAFQMAEAGLDRGIWKLQESDWHWNVASTGGVIPGYYNFNTVYGSTDTDGKAGEYKINLTSYTGGTGVVIQSIGRDKSTDEVRALEAAYTKTAINAGLLGRGGIEYKPNLEVHWGPVVCYSNITNAPSLYYPRKIVKGWIKGDNYCGSNPPTSQNAHPPNGHNFYSTWPDPATYDYNCYQTKLGNAPTIDTEGFKTKAKNTRVPPIDVDNMISTPSGSGYYTNDSGSGNRKARIQRTSGSGNAEKSYWVNCSTCVIYFDSKGEKLIVEMKGGTTSQLILQALVIDGRLSDSEFDFDGNDDCPDIAVKIPKGAKTEYAHTSAIGTWNSRGWQEEFTVNIGTARVRGYVYVKGNLKNSGGANPVHIGVIDVLGDVSVNNTIIYYDATVSTGILALNVKPNLQYWREIKKDW